MHPRALVKSTFLIFLCAVGVSPAVAQRTASSEEIRSMLRIASGLLPRIDENQRSSVAYNIAGQQMRIGDLSGALDSVKVAGNEDQRAWATSHIASVLAWQGNLPLALKLVRTSAKYDDRAKAQYYGDVAQALANRKAFEDALTVAHLIEDGPGFLGKTGLVVRTLMEIQAKQWATGDTAGAEGTLNAAMDWGEPLG